jgi:integrase
MGKERQYDGVRAASDSTIEIDFYYAGQRCRERLKLKPSPTNLKRAAQHRASILAAIDHGNFDYAVTFPKSKRAATLTKHPGLTNTLTTYLDTWLENKRPTIKASTYEGYLRAINGLIIPELGSTPLAELRRGNIKNMAAGMSAGNKRIANVLSVLRSALQDALIDDLIETNPLAGWTYRKTAPPKYENDVDPFDSIEQVTILRHLEGQARNLIQFALWTGLRTSELVALNWIDIDFERGEIRVRRAQTQAAKNVDETTKTKAGTRTVKLLPPALAALVEQKDHTFLKNLEIFQNPRTNERWTGDQPIRKTLWVYALKRAGVRYRNPYQTRHTYASMMLSAGEHPMWVAQQMGHTDWGMIRRIYGHWIPEADTTAGNRAVTMFGQDLASIFAKPSIGGA